MRSKHHVIYMSGWLSGLKQQFAKLSTVETRSEGSNPSPDAREMRNKLRKTKSKSLGYAVPAQKSISGTDA